MICKAASSSGPLNFFVRISTTPTPTHTHTHTHTHIHIYIHAHAQNTVNTPIPTGVDPSVSSKGIRPVKLYSLALVLRTLTEVTLAQAQNDGHADILFEF